jgi:S-layer protein
VTGVVTVNGALDFETGSSYTIAVQATSTDGSQSNSNFTIAVTDELEANTYFLTTNVDSGAAYTGGNGDDIFFAYNSASLSLDDLTPDVGNRLTALDTINGGTGSDTLNINDFTSDGLNAGTGAIVGLSVTSIETVNVTSVDQTTIDTTAWTGLTQLNSTLSTTADITAATTTNVTVSGTANATVEGGANVNVSSSGVVKVDGSSGNVTITSSASALVGTLLVSGGAVQGNVVVTSLGDITVGANSTVLPAVANVTATTADGGVVKVYGGTAVTVASSTLLSNTDTGAITVGGSFAPATGAVSVTATARLVEDNAGTATTVGIGNVDVIGGTTVTVNLSGTVSGGSDNGGDALTIGDVTVTGSAATTAVTVTQSAPVQQATNTLLTTDGTAAILNGDVKITDVTSAAGVADTITTVSVTNAGLVGITSSALTSLTLSGATGATAIGGQSTVEASTLGLQLNGGASAGVTATAVATGYTTVNVTSTGANTVGGLSVDKATKVNISGSGSLDLGTVTTAALGVITSTNTGGVTLSTVAIDQTFDGTLSTGNDVITLFAATDTVNSTGDGNDTVILTSLGAHATVDAGGGTADVLSLAALDAETLSANDVFEGQISNFERLSIGQVALPTAINLANIDDINYVTVAGGLFGDLDISGFATNGTLVQTAAFADPTAATTLTGAFTGANDTFTIAASGTDGFKNDATLVLALVEDLTITLADTDSVVNTAVFDLNLDAVTATSVTISGNAGIDLTTGLLTSVSTLNASGVTATGAFGAVTFIGNNVVSTITGGAGDDALTGGTQNDTITGGAGDDTIDGGAGNDVITGGAGSDLITLGLGNDTLVLNSLTGSDTIADYTVADDSIQLSKATFSALGAIGALTAGEFASLANAAALTGGSVAAATDAQQIIYLQTGELYYNADGATAGGLTLIGTLTGAPALVVGEFAIIA